MAGSIPGDFPELGPAPVAYAVVGVAEPIDVLVVLLLANELPAVGSQASDDSVDVVDCECEMADARGVRRRVRVAATARRGVELDQLEPSVAVRGLHHCVLHPDALETHDAVHPTAPDRPLALQLESEHDEERLRGREVVEDDAHVVHALDRHALDGSAGAGSTTPHPSKRNSDHAGRKRSLRARVPMSRTINPQTCANSSDQPSALTLAKSH